MSADSLSDLFNGSQILSKALLKVIAISLKYLTASQWNTFISNNTHGIFQGHAAPVLYAAWAEAGLFPAEDLMNLRKIDNDLEGHPTPVRSLYFTGLI